MPIQLDYQGPNTLNKQGPIFWTNARASVCFMLGVILPVLCFLFTANAIPFYVAPMSERFVGIAHLLLSGRNCWPLYPALLCPILAMASCCISPKSISIWYVRIGIYAGVFTSILFGLLYIFDFTTESTTPDSTPIQNSIALTIAMISVAGLLVSGLFYLEKFTIDRIAKPLWITLRIFHILFCIALVIPGAPLVAIVFPAATLFAFTWMATTCWQTSAAPPPAISGKIAWIAYTLLHILGWSAAIYNATAAYNDRPLPISLTP